MIEVNNRTKSAIDLHLIKRVVGKFLLEYKATDKEVSIAFVGDRAMRRLNKTYRKKDKITDVLAFVGEEDLLGEVVICYEQIKRQARRYGKTIKGELFFILTHGLLHLIGYDDIKDKDRETMVRLGENFVKKMKI